MSKAQIINNSFTVTFARQEKIRRKANYFEDAISNYYPSIQTLPIPDNVDPAIPRIIFDSAHGYSQIVISQCSISINVNYSEEYQTNVDQIKEYLFERVKLVFSLLNIAEVNRPYFCGLTTNVHCIEDKEDNDIIQKIIKNFNIRTTQENLNEIELKITNIIDDSYFNNTTIKNFRAWNFDLPLTDQPRLKINNAAIRGIEVKGDLNDRYSFNEKENYVTHLDTANIILAKGLNLIKSFTDTLE